MNDREGDYLVSVSVSKGEAYPVYGHDQASEDYPEIVEARWPPLGRIECFPKRHAESPNRVQVCIV